MGICVKSDGDVVATSCNGRCVFISSSTDRVTVITVGHTDIVLDEGVFIFSGFKTLVLKWKGLRLQIGVG